MTSIRRMTGLFALVLALTGGTAIATSASRSYAQPEALPTLGEHMDGMKDALRTIARGHKDEAQREAVLAAITQFQEHVVAAKGLVPQSVSKMPEEKRAEAVADYRARMALVLAESANLEVAYLDGEIDKVDEIIRGELFPLRDSGHNEFQKQW